MLSEEDRRDEFAAMPDYAIVAELSRRNPFGGYSIGTRRGQMKREQAIETLLRYEGYKREVTNARP